MSDKPEIYPITVPKWGMSMERGVIAAWRVGEGAVVARGDELLDIETEKIANGVEATHSGVLRRQIGRVGQTYLCGDLIGVIAAASVPEEAITAFVAQHEATPLVSIADRGSTPQMLEVKGQRVCYLVQGDQNRGAIPILLIHGLGADLHSWRLLQAALADTGSSYAVDLPGHGESSKDLSSIQSFSDVGELLLACLDEWRIDRAHVVAHSMGALIAREMVCRDAGRIASLSLLAPAGCGRAPNEMFIQQLIGAKTRRQVADVLTMLVLDKGSITREMAENVLKYKRMDGAEEALKRYAVWLAGADAVEPRWPEAVRDIPKAIVRGSADQIIEACPANAIKDWRVVLLPDVGHIPHLERCAATSQAIRTVMDLVERPE